MINNQTLILNKLNSLQNYKKENNFWNITWEQGVFISNLIDIKKPKHILEIGTSNGFSTLWIAKNLDNDSRIITVEVNEERLNEAKNNFNYCKLDNIECLHGNIFELITNLKEKLNLESFDFIFIDAEQEHYHTILEKLEKLDLLAINAIILFDNILNHDSTKDLPNKVNSNYYKEIIDIGSGMLFLQRT